MKILLRALSLSVVFATPMGFAQTMVFHCQASRQEGPHVIRYSSGPINGEGAEGMQVNAAWNRALQVKCPGLRGSCNAVGDPRGVQRKERFWISTGESVVHVDFTYISSRALAALPPSAADRCGTTTTHDLTTPVPDCRPATTSYVVCTASDASPTVYLSATFAVSALNGGAWTSGFRQFLAQRYSYQGHTVGCANIDATAARAYLRNRIVSLRANGQTAVQTGWTFGSSRVMPVVVPAAAALATPVSEPAAHPVHLAGKAYHCIFSVRRGQQPSRYSSGPIATQAVQSALNEAWKGYISTTYHPGAGSGGCQIMSGSPAHWERAVSSYEQNSERLHVTIIHVDWTSAPGQTR